MAVMEGAVGTWAMRIDAVFGIELIVRDEMALPARSDIAPLFRSRELERDMPFESYSSESLPTV